MLRVTCEPPVRSKSAESFVQTVRLLDGEELVAYARWQCTGDLSHGVAQLLELTVSESRRRQGHGRRVMDAVSAQAQEYFRSRKLAMRRLWVAIEQKRQVIGRSFLMQFGFNHEGTMGEMLKD
jgi:GNAT superfamily N-acetyltransferase